MNTYNKNYHRFSGITPKDLMGDFPEGTFDVGISGDEDSTDDGEGITPKDLMGDFPEGTFDVGISGDEDSIDGDEDISSKGGREE